MASVWKLLYSLDQHGASLQTLYSMTRDYVGPCVWMMKDEDGQVMDQWHESLPFFFNFKIDLWCLFKSYISIST